MQCVKLYRFHCNPCAGGGVIFCDSKRCPWLAWTLAEQGRLRALRALLQHVVSFVVRALPQLADLLQLLREGYAATCAFRGFCTRKHIVINLHAFLHQMKTISPSDTVPSRISSNASLFYALLLTLT